MKKICIVCGKEYEGNYNSKVCCWKCREINNIARNNGLTIEEVKKIGFNECKICGAIGFNLSTHLRVEHHLSIKEYCKQFNCSEREVINEYAHNNIVNGQKKLQEKGYKTNFQTNNPGKGHNGSLSPFSRNFIKYKGLSEEEITERINDLQKKAKKTTTENNNNTTRLEYYTSRGYTEEEAKQLLKDRQTTFTLEKCIQKYGKKEGTKRYNERQEKWQATLNAKSDKEKQRIYELKIEGFKKAREMNPNKPYSVGYSKISQELFKAICEDKRIGKYEDIFYATKGIKVNNEYVIEILNEAEDEVEAIFFLDFYIKSLNKCIEFDGTYWHGSEEAKAKDKRRDELLNKRGIQVLHIKEEEYCKFPKRVTNRCIRWLLKK